MISTYLTVIFFNYLYDFSEYYLCPRFDLWHETCSSLIAIDGEADVI